MLRSTSFLHAPSLPPQGPGAVLLAGGATLALLPLWAQSLLAARMLERARLAAQATIPDPLNTLLQRCCAAIGDCARDGGGVTAQRALFDAGVAQRYVDGAAGPGPLRHALYYALDATRAAAAAQDFPIDATVTHSSLRCIAALASWGRLVPLQIHVLLTSDIDLAEFACREARTGRYDALTSAILQRFTGLHPLTLIDAADADRTRR